MHVKLGDTAPARPGADSIGAILVHARGARAGQQSRPDSEGGADMAKRARKKKDQKKNKANHGKKPLRG